MVDAMDLAELESHFKPSQASSKYMARRGPAYTDPDPDARAPLNKKLCLVATDQAFLVELLLELSRREDAFFVKYSVAPRDAMYLGRCFLTDEWALGTLWQELKVNPKLMCSVQDDDWSIEFRRQSGEMK